MRFESVPEMSAAAALAAVDAGALLLDVREEFEWERGHAPQALHIAMSELGEQVEALPTDRTIVCVCHVGGRSAMSRRIASQTRGTTPRASMRRAQCGVTVTAGWCHSGSSLGSGSV